ncbi:DUF4878 domain-containing protein [Helicobacter jaachi]|nr:DUF4878 domain-containing protein [Helicobacter jaachi]
MKGLKTLGLALGAIIISVFLTACGENTPKDVAVAFMEDVYKGNGDKLLGYIDLPEKAEEVGMKEMLEGKLKAGAAEAKQKAQNAGGLKSVEMISEDIKEKTGVVVLRIKFEDGNEDTEQVKVIKVDDEWKIKL